MENTLKTLLLGEEFCLKMESLRKAITLQGAVIAPIALLNIAEASIEAMVPEKATKAIEELMKVSTYHFGGFDVTKTSGEQLIWVQYGDYRMQFIFRDGALYEFYIQQRPANRSVASNRIDGPEIVEDDDDTWDGAVIVLYVGEAEA